MCVIFINSKKMQKTLKTPCLLSPFPHHARDFFSQQVTADGLGDVFVHSCFDTTFAISLHGMCRHGDNW